MKKKAAIMIGMLMLGSLSFSASRANESIESSLGNLEKQLSNLQNMEDRKFAEEEAKANAAGQQLAEYQKISDAIDEKISEIDSNADRSIFGREMKETKRKYKVLKKDLEKQMAQLQKTVDSFEMIKSLRSE